MRSRLSVFILLGVGVIFSALVGRQMWRRPLWNPAQPTMRVLAYSSFVGKKGAGPEIVKAFESQCGCRVELVSAGDAGMILERLRLGPNFDVVVGLDALQLPIAQRDFKWRNLNQDSSGWFEGARKWATANSQFAPLDWSPLTFVYKVRDGDDSVPKNLEDLATQKWKGALALQNPRTSAPGMQFYAWIQAVKGVEGAQAWLQKLKPNVGSLSPNWSMAYGLFRQGQARFVFTYLTSLAYHWGVERDRSFRAFSFPEGHPVQMELAAVPNTCQQCALAEKFVAYLQAPDAQKILMEKNNMFPIRRELTAGTVFAELPELKWIDIQPVEDWRAWDATFAH